MPPKTRKRLSSSLNDIVGTGRHLLENQVPTLRAALRKALIIREEKSHLDNTHVRNMEISEIMNDVVEDVKRLWLKSNFLFQRPVIITDKAIKKTLLNAWETAKDIGRNRITKKASIEKFQKKLDKVLDITTCHCKISPCSESSDPCKSSCGGFHISCKCPSQVRIPPQELRWIYYERNRKSEDSGGMQLGSGDRVESDRIDKSLKRKPMDQDRLNQSIRRQIQNKKICILVWMKFEE